MTTPYPTDAEVEDLALIFQNDGKRNVAWVLRSLLAQRRELMADKERLAKVGELLPTMLEALPWGAYKGALLEDGVLKYAIQLAARAQETKG